MAAAALGTSATPTPDKGVLDVDYLIDDTPRHFRHLRGVPVLFSAPHND